MRLLLDTHIWLWYYTSPEKLTSEVARELANPAKDRFLSPVSIWETIILLEKRRVNLRQDFGEWFKQSVADLELIRGAFALEGGARVAVDDAEPPRSG